MPLISEKVVRASVKNAQTLVANHIDNGGPIDLDVIGREVGVDAIESADISVDGYVGKMKNGNVVIRYRRDNSMQRNRFTIAHEIGHLIISRVTGVPITERKMRTGFDTEELLANRLAAELLMPTQSMRAWLFESRPCWNAVQAMRRYFDVSAIALLRRTTEIEGIASIFARFKNNESGQSRQLVSWNCTACPQPSFHRPFQQLVPTTTYDAGFYIRCCVGNEKQLLPCQIRHISTNIHHYSWIYGWKKL